MRNKWMIAALVVSVTVNLLLIGFAVGRWGDAPAHIRNFMDPAPNYLRALRALPKERRHEIRKAMQGWERHGREGRGSQPTFRGMRETQRAIEDALAAEPFDPDALAAALARFRDQMAEGQGYGHETLVAVAAQLTADERRMLLERMHQRARARHGHRRHGSPSRGSPSPGSPSPGKGR